MIEDWQRRELEQLGTETPVIHWMSAVRFVSRSAGRLKRRRPRVVTLIRYGGGISWKTKCPFDEWATEVLGEHADGEQLKEQFELAIRNGRF